MECVAMETAYSVRCHVDRAWRALSWRQRMACVAMETGHGVRCHGVRATHAGPRNHIKNNKPQKKLSKGTIFSMIIIMTL